MLCGLIAFQRLLKILSEGERVLGNEGVDGGEEVINEGLLVTLHLFFVGVVVIIVVVVYDFLLLEGGMLEQVLEVAFPDH